MKRDICGKKNNSYGSIREEERQLGTHLRDLAKSILTGRDGESYAERVNQYKDGIKLWKNNYFVLFNHLFSSW